MCAFLTVETDSKYIREEESVSRPLIGDGASETLIVGLNTDFEGMQGFVFGTDGSGYRNLIVSVCSIPIALSDLLTQKPHTIFGCVMLIGFGVGLSWGGCMVNLSSCIKN